MTEPDDDPDLGSAPAGEHPTIFELRTGQCRFPIGGPAEPARFFCGKPAVLPKPYCRECCGRAYVVLRPPEARVRK
jgi:hypothetical protein